jgi:hypothetical protein
MLHPRGRRNLPGHAKRLKDGLAACECGWAAVDLPRTKAAPWKAPGANDARGRHLIDVRMGEV